MRTALLTATLLLIPLGAADAQGNSGSTPAAARRTGGMRMVVPDSISWGPAPASLPPGASAVVLAGDPARSGVFTLRLRFPDGYRIPPHWHPTTENVTVISGTMMVGMGDTLVEGAMMRTMSAGSFASLPARMRHYAMARGETVLQVQGTGPFAVNYVRRADDPRRKATAAGK